MVKDEYRTVPCHVRRHGAQREGETSKRDFHLRQEVVVRDEHVELNMIQLFQNTCAADVP